MRRLYSTIGFRTLSLALGLLSAGASGGALAAVVPTGEPVKLGTSTMSQEPKQVAWAGNRFAVVLEVGEASPGRVLLRYRGPHSTKPTEPVELAAVGAWPAVASFPDGSLVVVWTDYTEWYVRFVDAAGQPTGDAVPLGLPNASRMRVAAGSQGNWLVVFHNHIAELMQTDLLGWRFQGVEPKTEVPFVIGASPWRNSAAMLPDNRFLAAWSNQVWHDDCNDCGFECCYDWTTTYMYGRGYDGAGEPFTAPGRLGQDFHHDEQGEMGHDIAPLAGTGFVGAWLDSFEMDYPEPTYLVVRTFDGDGVPTSASRVLDEFDTDTAWTSIAATSGQIVVAVSSQYYEDGANADIQLYSTSVDTGPVEMVRLSTPESPHDHAPRLAAGDQGALLLLWNENVDLTPVDHILAQPFFAAATIACGDASLDGQRTAVDALAVLQSGVGARYCALPVCDTTGNGAVTASDASRTLRASVGIDEEFLCPPAGVEVTAPIPDPWW